MNKPLAVAALLAVVTAQGCKTGFNRTYRTPTQQEPPPCATAPADNDLSDQSMKVFNLLAGLTCANEDYSDGYLVGQSLGYGGELLDADSLNSYARLIDGLENKPAVVSVDYEGNRLYNEETLLDVNEQLTSHWEAGGLVSISWRPLSPWANDFSDIEGEPGSIEDTYFDLNNEIDLADLLDDTTPEYAIWQNKLQAMAVALQDLEDKGVTVLWQPLPEAVTDTYWWGTAASDYEDNEAGADLYTDLWQQMFEYFDEQGLDNLLWVYSPGESSEDYAVEWAYPGEGYVDVVAGTAYDDSLDIDDYDDLVDLGRPVAMAAYGPDRLNAKVISEPEGRGRFSNIVYRDRLYRSYPSVSYWLAGETLLIEQEGKTVRSNLALIDNNNATPLLQDGSMISVEKMVEKKMRE